MKSKSNELTKYEMLLIRACKIGKYQRLEKLYKSYHLIDMKEDALDEGICYDLSKITNKFNLVGVEGMIFEVSKSYRFSKGLYTKGSKFNPIKSSKFNPIKSMKDVLINRIRFENPKTFGEEMIWPSKYKKQD